MHDRYEIPRSKIKAKPIRNNGTLLGFKCPVCNFEILGAGGAHWHSRAESDVNYHIALEHRQLPPARQIGKTKWR